MTKEDFKARVSMAYEGREQWEAFLNRVWSIHTSELPHWISVEDELPPRWEKYPHLSEDVLCSDGVNVMLNSYDYSEAEWTYGVGMSSITHWMPMPQPPIVSKMENTEKKGGNQ